MKVKGSAIVLLAALVVLFVLAWLVPAEAVYDESVSVCPHKIMTGIECPLCGMTRATYEMAHFHPLTAFSFNPMVFPLLITVLLWQAYLLFQKESIRRIFKYSIVVLVGGLVVLYIIRIIEGLQN